MQRRCIGALALALVIALCGGAAADELRATGIGDTGFGRFRDGATDATAAIQAALDAAAARGAVVLLPEGQYRIDGSLSVAEGDWIASAAERILYENIEFLRYVNVHYHPAPG